MRTVNIIGCGKVGRALARVARRHRLWDLLGVLNRSPASAAEAVEFIGAGRPVACCCELPRAEVVMISASDRAIGDCCRRLCDAGLVDPGVIVFHPSGALPAAVLEPARRRGAAVASAHPVKSFADPAAAAESFAGTFCGLEGDDRACAYLEEMLRECGAETFPIDPESKTVYHAATVMISNYLAALVEAGLRCFEKAGVPRETAAGIARPIVRETLENVFTLGPVGALTGPIARGEADLVAGQCDALGQWDEQIRDVYRSLGRVAVELAAAQGSAEPESLAAIARTLSA